MKTKSVYTSLIATLLLLISFQNCSKVAFQTQLSSTGELTNQEVIRSLEPALAIRAVGCMGCHTSATSNVITDFGANDFYFFGQNFRQAQGDGWHNGSPYGDHGDNFKYINLTAGNKLITTSAALPSAVKNATNTETLAQYLTKQLSLSPNAGTKSVQVQEMNDIVIGAPTSQELISAFGLGSSRAKFRKGFTAASDFTGIFDQGTFFKNSGTVVCDGDLVVRGPLYLENLSLQTEKGCRIYVIGSVFLYGAVSYVSSSDLRNLQITATKSINLGLGLARDAAGNFCDPNGKFAKEPNSYDPSSLVSRYVKMWTVPAQNVRGGQDPVAYGQSVVDELKSIEASIGTVRDAECRPEGRNVGFERILLNAQTIHSRYTGQVKGTIIAEFALMALNNFNFEFDPVFRSVDVLPRLAQANFLQVK